MLKCEYKVYIEVKVISQLLKLKEDSYLLGIVDILLSKPRGCFGIVIRNNDDGDYEGGSVKYKPFNYTSRNIESIPKFEQLITNALASY